MQLAQWSNESNAKAKKTRTSTAAAVARVTVDRAKGAAIRAAGLDRADTGDAESAVMAATAAFEAAKAESGGDVPRLLTRDGKARHVSRERPPKAQKMDPLSTYVRAPCFCARERGTH